MGRLTRFRMHWQTTTSERPLSRMPPRRLRSSRSCRCLACSMLGHRHAVVHLLLEAAAGRQALVGEAAGGAEVAPGVVLRASGARVDEAERRGAHLCLGLAVQLAHGRGAGLLAARYRSAAAAVAVVRAIAGGAVATDTSRQGEDKEGGNALHCGREVSDQESRDNMC